MRKILAVAKNEFLVSVKSKAFIIGVIMMPVLMGGSILVQILFKDHVDKTDRRVAIVDRSGSLYEALERANEDREANEVYSKSEDGEGKQVRPRFLLERYEESEGDADTELALSDRVRKGDLFAFLIIDENVMDPSFAEGEGQRMLSYHTKTPTFRDLPNWLRNAIHQTVIARRFEDANMDRAMVQKLNRRVNLTSLGLVKRDQGGKVEKAKKENEFQTFGVPIVSIMMLFMLVMMTAPALLNQVLEEKMQKISEVLVSSVTPFELLMGKLIGIVGTALALSFLYLGSAFVTMEKMGYADMVDPSVFGWFILFLILALFIFGSIFSAVGAACTEIKDAQSLMMPAMMLLMVPMFSISIILKSPSGIFAVIMSLFPPTTPMIMMLRIALPPGPPLWQILLSVVLTVIFTIGCVMAAGKVFRIGILSQGQTPSLAKLVKWIVTK